MVGYYRLKDFGARLQSGAYLIAAEDFAAVDEAKRLLEAAELWATQITERAQRAFNEESARGYQEGLEAARDEALRRLVSESSALDQSLQRIESDLAQLVGVCVRKIVYGFDDTQRVETVVRQALARMRKEKRAELRVAKSIFRHFRSEIDKIRRDFPEVELVDVVADESLVAEQVVLEASIGRIDGNLGQAVEDLLGLLQQGLDPPEAARPWREAAKPPREKNEDAWTSADDQAAEGKGGSLETAKDKEVELG